MPHKYIKLFLIIFIFLSSTDLFAQKTIHGTIRNAKPASRCLQLTLLLKVYIKAP